MPIRARVGRVRFSASWWSLALTLFGLALFGLLSVWQVHRGTAKDAIIAASHRAAKEHPIALGQWLAAGKSAHALYLKPVQLTGHYDSTHQLLLDNQTWDQEDGYHVWTPFVLQGGKYVVLVDRGWVHAGPTRQQLPDPQVTATTLDVKGIMHSFPSPGIRLSQGKCPSGDHWPHVVEYPRFRNLHCLYDGRLVDGLVLLDPGEPHGFPRRWLKVGMSPARHFGYAFEWFAMGLTALVMFIAINTTIEPRTDD